MTFEQIIWAFPFAAIAIRLLVEVWCRHSLFCRTRAWIEVRKGVWWADVLRIPLALSCLAGTVLTMGMFAAMEGRNGTYAQLALLVALALINLPQVILPFSKS